eukprot:5680289-Heterocapsa_arctica.AAC.1
MPVALPLAQAAHEVHPPGLDPPAAVPAEDVRTLPVLYNVAGFRQREFRDMLNLATEDPWPDFPVRGPRTCRWVLQFMLEHGGTP